MKYFKRKISGMYQTLHRRCWTNNHPGLFGFGLFGVGVYSDTGKPMYHICSVGNTDAETTALVKFVISELANVKKWEI